MVHCITLFFLSIGAHFGQPNLDYNNHSTAQLKSSKMSIKYARPAKGIDSSRSKLYSDNKGLIKIQPIGHDGWVLK
jgi:hypothetical protein